MTIYRLRITSCEESSTLYVSSDEDLTQEQLNEKFHAALIASIRFSTSEYPPTDLAALFYLVEQHPIVLEEQGLKVLSPALMSFVFGWANTDNPWASYANSETGELLAKIAKKGYRLGWNGTEW